MTGGTVTINEKNYTFDEGETILDVARRNHIPIPVLCYLKDIAETGACRICLVEVEGVPVPVASCAAFVTDGMVVRTETEELKKHRRNALEFILLKHPLECDICENAGECQLRRIAKLLGVSEVTGTVEKMRKPLVDWHMFWYNQELCVVCQRCSKVCREVTGCSALEVFSRGGDTRMSPVGDSLECDYCGICADVCPVGAILDKSFKQDMKISQLENIHTSCPFCPVGCRLNYGTKNGKIYRIHRSGDGYTCSKGRYGFKFLESSLRITTPEIKKNKTFMKVSWQDALVAIKEGLTRAGAENSLIVAGSRLTNEELFNFSQFATKTGMKYITEAEISIGHFMRHYYAKFGRYESVGTLKDLESCELIFVIGADFARECVGVKWHMLKAAMRNESKIITIGLQRYEYDDITYASIIADFADFALEFEKIKTSNSNIYSSIRSYIRDAQSIGIVIGNEYLSGEEYPESVLAFADFIGAENLKVFMPTNDKVNYVGALYAGGAKLEDIMENKPKAVLAMAVNPGKGKLEPLSELIRHADFYATPEIFITGTVNDANVVLPVKASLEDCGSYTALDGKFERIRPAVEPPVNVKSNSETASALAGLFKKKIEADNSIVFAENAEQFGFAAADWGGFGNVYRKSPKPLFNKTEYEYRTKDHTRIKTVYVNPRHHEGVLTMIREADPADIMPLLPGVEVIVKPGTERSLIDADNIAKGVSLVPRGTKF